MADRRQHCMTLARRNEQHVAPTCGMMCARLLCAASLKTDTSIATSAMTSYFGHLPDARRQTPFSFPYHQQNCCLIHSNFCVLT
jgi:hypothetical protein